MKPLRLALFMNQKKSRWTDGHAQNPFQTLGAAALLIIAKITGKFSTNHKVSGVKQTPGEVLSRCCGGEQLAAVRTNPNLPELEKQRMENDTYGCRFRRAAVPHLKCHAGLQRRSVLFGSACFRCRGPACCLKSKWGTALWCLYAGRASVCADWNLQMKSAGETLALPYHLNTALTGSSAIILPAIFLDKLLHL